METICAQTELDKLIDLMNSEEKFKKLNIQKFKIENPLDFTDKTPINEKEKS